MTKNITNLEITKNIMNVRITKIDEIVKTLDNDANDNISDFNLVYNLNYDSRSSVFDHMFDYFEQSYKKIKKNKFIFEVVDTISK